MKSLLILLALALTGCARHSQSASRDDRWAQKVEVAGVKNLYQVSTTLYRSYQPTQPGMINLEERGIKTVVSLRAFHSDRHLLKATDLAYERIAFQTWAPDDDELIRFLNLATDPQKTPVLVHCLHGSDRTGAMCAAYRIVVDGWSHDAAILEMKKGGYGHHKIWSNLEDWIRNFDVEALRVKAGRDITW